MVELANGSEEGSFAKKSLFARHPQMKDWPSSHGKYNSKNNSIIVLLYYYSSRTFKTIFHRCKNEVYSNTHCFSDIFPLQFCPHFGQQNIQILYPKKYLLITPPPPKEMLIFCNASKSVLISLVPGFWYMTQLNL